MFKCIDFHTHIYPENNSISQLKTYIPEKYKEKILSKSKIVSKHYSSVAHLVQQKIYHVPDALRSKIDPFLLSFTLPTLPLSSSAEDLKNEMSENNVAACVIVSHPPFITNQYLIEQSQKYENFFPCLTYAGDTFDSIFNQKNKFNFLLKLNPMAFDFDLNSIELKKVLDFWNQKQWPVLIHTGALYSRFFKQPEKGNIQYLENLVSKYKNIHFILAHMNIFKPFEAIEFCQNYSNTSATTSWQPPEVILDAAKKIGYQRILFSSDWPLLGDNIHIRKKILTDLYEKKLLSNVELESILYSNAQIILENYFSKKV